MPRLLRHKDWRRKRNARYRSCKSKMAHNTEAQAQNHIETIRAKGDQSPHLTAYPCTLCGKFHVGHTRPRTKAGKKWGRGPSGSSAGNGTVGGAEANAEREQAHGWAV